MVFIFRDKTFKLDLTAYILCGFISVGLSILFYTYRDINFDLKTYKQVRQSKKKREGEMYDYKRKRFSRHQANTESK